MIHKDKIEQERANALKAVRTLIRLKHSIAADEELNEKLPIVQKKYDDAELNERPMPSLAEVRKAAGV